MEDRDGKKPFIIPKTHTSTKDVVISEKPDSRNVTDLFDDIKNCAFEAQFDFRPNGCKSCDTIRNLKLQKLYNEKRIKMKKDQDPIERLAFHLITYRDVALDVANEGLCCEQLSFPINKYLGNPKDGVHLSKRPDVLLTSSGAQGLYRFGLLVCKVLLGKGYATLPSTNNNQLPAQLHYDHHFCKIQSINKEQRHIDDLLANSLIFCYEHENFETLSHPPQILPIAILWYDLTEKFAPELISTTTIKSISNQESQHRSGKITKNQTTIKPKTFNPPKKPTSSPAKKSSISQSGSWEEPTQETTTSELTQTSNTTEPPTTKYPSHFMVPCHRVYSAPPLFISTNTEDQQINPTQPMSNSRDPRLLRTKRETTHSSSETIPLSPQHLLHERSLSDSSSSTKLLKSSSDEPVLITKSTTSIYIPLNSSASLIDPRLKTIQSTRNIFYLELHAVKHALQQQKRLNHYYDSKSGLPLKTSYTLVPYLIREVSNDEYERILHDNNKTYKFSKHSSGIHYSSLYVSVVDCLNFGLVKSTADNQNYVDLEQNENRLAYEQIEISNELIQREKQLNSQQIRLRLREKRQRRIQQQINERKNFKSSLTSPSSSSTSISVYSSKSYITTGRKFLKDYQAPMILPNTHVSTDFLEFFSREYKNENRSHVRHLLAELVGVFIEKYHLNDNQMLENHNENGEVNHSLVKESVVDDQTINSVIDMDLDSPSPQGLCDHDERFRAPSPPPLSSSLLLPLSAAPMTNATVYTQPPISTSLIQTLSKEPTKIFNDPNYTDRCHKLLEQLEQYRQKEMTLSKLSVITKSEAVIPPEETLLKSCLGQLRSSSRENSPIDHNHSLIISADSPHEEDLLLPLIQNSPINIPEDSSRSRDEFVKLLTKEAYISKSSSPVKDQNKPKRSYNHDNQRRQSHDENKNKQSLLSACSNSHRRYSRSVNNKTRCVKPIEKKLSSTRTVTLVSNRATVSTDNQEEKQHPDRSVDSRNDLHEEPAVKRIKIDCLPPPSNTTKEVDHTNETNPNDSNRKSLVTVPVVNDDHDYRRDLNKKRRTVSNTNSVVSSTDITETKSARSRSRSKSKDQNQRRRQSSTNSHSSSMKSSQTSSESNKKLKTHSQPFRSPSNDDNHHRSRQKQNHNDHRPERKQSFDLANHHHKQYSNQLLGRHEKSYRNSTSSVYRQRNTNDLIPPSNVHHLPQQQQQLVRHKRFNYNHQSVADHPRFANTSTLPSSAPVLDFNYATPPIQHHRVPSATTGDRNSHSSYHKNRYLDRSESTKSDYADRFDSKSSHAIERLQILLENKTNDSREQLPMDYAVNKTVKYSSSSTNKDNSQRISSRSHSSKTKTDTIMQNNNNNPTFTFNDSEKLLNMIQRSRNS